MEGHEIEVILGSKNFLKNNYCFIQVEVLNKDKFDDLNILMSDLGYKKVHQIEDHYYSNFI